jgi:GNAT superfamily N-acetyltransferase
MTELSNSLPEPDDYRWCHLRFAERTILLDDDEPSRFLQEYGGSIEWEDPEGSKPRVTLGSFRAYLVDVAGAITEGESITAVWDTTQSTWSTYEQLFDSDTEELTEAAKRTAFGVDYQLNEGVLILDRMAILPEHRGHGLGLLSMKAIIEQFRQACGLVVIKPFPLQFEGDGPSHDEWPPNSALELKAYSQSMRTALSKLKRYYSCLGFRSVRGTEYMVVNPSLNFADYDALISPRLVARRSRA